MAYCIFPVVAYIWKGLLNNIFPVDIMKMSWKSQGYIIYNIQNWESLIMNSYIVDVASYKKSFTYFDILSLIFILQ